MGLVADPAVGLVADPAVGLGTEAVDKEAPRMDMVPSGTADTEGKADKAGTEDKADMEGMVSLHHRRYQGRVDSADSADRGDRADKGGVATFWGYSSLRQCDTRPKMGLTVLDSRRLQLTGPWCKHNC